MSVAAGWLYRGEQLTSLRRQLGWARIYADDPGVRSIDKARRDKKVLEQLTPGSAAAM